MFMRRATLRRCYVSRLAFPTGLDRAHLFGTALAFSLLVSSLLASAPAFTQSVEVAVSQTNFIDNSGDIGPGGINAVIAGSTFSQANSAAVVTGNSGAVSTDSFTAKVRQSNTIDANIDIDNSDDFEGDDIGINAEITGNDFSQANSAAVVTDNSGAFSTDSFTAKVRQSNTIDANIDIDNSGHVEGDNIGINAEITGNDFSQANSAAVVTDNSGAFSTDSFTAKVRQSNTIDANIDIDNSGHVEGDNIGINAEITGNDFSQANSAAVVTGNSGAVSTESFTAKVRQSNRVDNTIKIDNSGTIKGGDIGINAVIAGNTSVQANIADVVTDNSGAFSTDSFTAKVRQSNTIDANIDIDNSGSVFGGTLGILAIGGITDITNTGLIHAYAQGPNASATGIEVGGLATIKNNGGTIWAGSSTDGGATIHRGVAIDTGDFATLQFQGTQADGHIYGDIDIASGAIEVTDGKTFFEGTINSPGNQIGSLDIFDGGKLVLCQESWTDSCDPNGWGNADWDPQQGVDGPSSVFIDTFTNETDGTLAYQLTPKTATGTYPQVFVNTANLGGTLEAQYLPGFYANKSLYDNIIEAGVRNGTFDTVEDNSLLLNTKVVYDGDNVDLRVKRTAFDQIKGLNRNQDSAAGAIENIYPKLPGSGVNPATTNPFAQLVANLFLINDKRDYAALLDQLSGAQFAQELQSVLWSLRPLNELITDRMDCGLNQSNIGPVARGYNDGGYEPSGCFRPGQVQAWARAWGGWNNNDGDANAPGYDERQWGIWGGADYALGDTVVLGVAGGFFRSDMDFERFGGVSGGSIEYDGGQIAGYAGWDNSVWYDRAIVSAGFYDGESHRNFALDRPAVDPSGSPDADAVSFYNEAGRRFTVGNNVALTPFAGITVAHAELDGFTENDRQKTGAALKISGSDADSVASILGLRFNGSWGAFKPQVAVGWEHEFDDTSQIVKVSFAGAPSGSNFKVVGTDLDDDALVVDAGGSYTVGPASDISVRYVGRFLDDYDAQSVMGRWTYKFGAAPVAAPTPPVKSAL